MKYIIVELANHWGCLAPLSPPPSASCCSTCWSVNSSCSFFILKMQQLLHNRLETVWPACQLSSLYVLKQIQILWGTYSFMLQWVCAINKRKFRTKQLQFFWILYCRFLLHYYVLWQVQYYVGGRACQTTQRSSLFNTYEYRSTPRSQNICICWLCVSLLTIRLIRQNCENVIYFVMTCFIIIYILSIS
jgi:hypothetical protein